MNSENLISINLPEDAGVECKICNELIDGDQELFINTAKFETFCKSCIVAQQL